MPNNCRPSAPRNTRRSSQALPGTARRSRALHKSRDRVQSAARTSAAPHFVRLSTYLPAFAILHARPMSLAPVKSSPSTQDSAVISINGLVKQFGRFAALRGVTAQFTPGRLYVILGDNGAGKTTLLRSLAGLAQPTRGNVTVLGATD